MVLYGDEDFVTAIAKLLEISRQTASAKLNSKSDFTRSEIVIVSKHYNLSAEEIQQIFIADEYNESERSCCVNQNSL